MILSEKHQMMRKLYRQFAETEFTPEILEKLDETGEFNWDIFNLMAKYGFTGTKIPVQYGGQGGDSLSYVLMVEEFARVSPVLSIYANPCCTAATKSRSRSMSLPLPRARRSWSSV